MNKFELPQDFWIFIRSGALSGLFSTLIFTIVHHIFIADIWFSFPIMALAGIISGVFIIGSYRILFVNPSVMSWIKYNTIYIVMFLLLGAFSVIYFDPITTVAAVMSDNVRPDELINKALPMSAFFTVAFSLIICLLYARHIIHYVVVFATCILLMIILGLNVSIIGLVEIPTSSFFLVMELFGLIFLILSVFTGVLIVLERKRLFNN